MNESAVDGNELRSRGVTAALVAGIFLNVTYEVTHRPVVAVADVLVALTMVGWMVYWTWVRGVPLPAGWAQRSVLWFAVMVVAFAAAFVLFRTMA